MMCIMETPSKSTRVSLGAPTSRLQTSTVHPATFLPTHTLYRPLPNHHPRKTCHPLPPTPNLLIASAKKFLATSPPTRLYGVSRNLSSCPFLMRCQSCSTYTGTTAYPAAVAPVDESAKLAGIPTAAAASLASAAVALEYDIDTLPAQIVIAATKTIQLYSVTSKTVFPIQDGTAYLS